MFTSDMMPTTNPKEALSELPIKSKLESPGTIASFEKLRFAPAFIPSVICAKEINERKDKIMKSGMRFI